MLLLPAAIGWLISYVLPTVWTVRSSLRSVSALPNRPSRSVGLANRDPVRVLTAYNMALSIGVVALVVAAVVAPVLAYAAYQAGRVGRWVVRLAFALPMVLVAPTLLTLSRRIPLTGTRAAADPISAIGTVHLVAWLTSTGLVCGLAVTAFLAVFHRPPPQRGAPWMTALVVAGLLVIGTVAVALTYVTSTGRATASGPVYGIAAANQYPVGLFPPNTAYPLALVLLLAAGLGVAQLLYLDRLTIRIGRR